MTDGCAQEYGTLLRLPLLGHWTEHAPVTDQTLRGSGALEDGRQNQAQDELLQPPDGFGWQQEQQEGLPADHWLQMFQSLHRTHCQTRN